MLSAVTGPLGLSKGSWASAYLVLVAGVAQYVMGLAAAHWRRAGAEALGWWWFAVWNLGHIGVLTGSVLGATAVVFVGSGILVIALVMAFVSTCALRRPAHRMLLLGYRVLLVLLAISIPIGMVMSALRNG